MADEENGCQLAKVTYLKEHHPNAPVGDIHSKSKRKKTPSCCSMAHEGSTMVFRDVCVTLNKTEILQRVSGMARAGEILAIMGPSGAGKSTLLNTLACRVQPTSGSITLNGQAVSRKLRRKISYVLQQDIFFPTLTLRQTLTFMTQLRLPDSMPKDLKLRRMDEVVDALELRKCLDTPMGGTFITGLSGGEKKRASIACELLTNPNLLLLDEPTSGLDSAIAYSLMSTLAKYSMQSSKTILTTIHQPSSQIFHMFSRILLLCDGEVAYFGPSNKIIDFFSRLGLHCDPLYNPADFILEQVKSDPATVKRIVEGAYGLRTQDDWPSELSGSAMVQGEPGQPKEDGPSSVVVHSGGSSGKTNYAFSDTSVTVDGFEMMADVEGNQQLRSVQAYKEVDVDAYINDDETWQTGFMTQFLTLTHRAFVEGKRRFLSPLNLCHFFIIIIAGLEWFQLSRTEETANDRLGILFFMIVNQGFIPILDAVYRIFDSFGVFHRERSSGIYRLSAYYLAVNISELPFSMLLITVYTTIVYWMTNLMPAASNFFACWFILVISMLVSQSFGLFVGVLVTNPSFTIAIANMFMILFLLLGGFYNTHVAEWFIWCRYLSYVTYTLSATGKIEFMYGDDLLCNPPNKTLFPESCVNGTTFKGIEFLNMKNLTFFPLYADILVLLGLIVLLRILCYILLRYFRRPKAQ